MLFWYQRVPRGAAFRADLAWRRRAPGTSIASPGASHFPSTRPEHHVASSTGAAAPVTLARAPHPGIERAPPEAKQRARRSAMEHRIGRAPGRKHRIVGARQMKHQRRIDSRRVIEGPPRFEATPRRANPIASAKRRRPGPSHHFVARVPSGSARLHERDPPGRLRSPTVPPTSNRGGWPTAQRPDAKRIDAVEGDVSWSWARTLSRRPECRARTTAP